MKLYLKTHQVIGFFAAVVLLGCLGVFAYMRIGSVIASAGHLTHASRIVASAEQVMTVLTAAQTGVRGYVITGDEQHLKAYLSAPRDLDSHLETLAHSTDDDAQAERVHRLSDEIDGVMEFAEKMVSTRREAGFDAARDLVAGGEGIERMSRVYDLIEEIKQYERDVFRNRNIITAEGLLGFRAWLALLAITATLIVVYLFYRMNSHLAQRTQVEKNLRKASEEIGELNKELEGYTYSVSHDLRAPLRSIAGYAQVLKEDYSDKLDEEGNRVVDVVIRNAHQMGQLIDDLLHFSRMGRKEVSRSLCDMDEIVNNVLREMGVEEPGPRLKITTDTLGAAMADSGMIKQVWSNLISNAVKYSSRKDVAEIEVGATPGNGEIIYHVKDNGVGFNMTYRDKLFGVFQRLHKSTEFPGTGVGLALVKRIVTRHGGRIWAEAQLGVGATFYFTLPLQFNNAD